MRKMRWAAFLIPLLLSATTHAGGMAVKAGYQFGVSDRSLHEIYACLEHFVPLIPNAGLRRQWLSGQASEFTNSDLLLYYELLETDHLGVQLGGGLRRHSKGLEINMDLPDSMSSIKDTFPLLFAHVYFMFSDRLGSYAQLEKGSGNHARFKHMEVGLSFAPLWGIELRAGYRQYQAESEGALMLAVPDTSGFSLGLHATLGF
ncbi:MAG: hypothetical protein OXC07_08495 [Kistimonas sp.]|nr:hypothetical protein [Kistimonas sp.]